MVKAQSEENADIISKNLHTPKDGSVQKKKNQKFKQTPTGKVTLINGSKAHNSSMKQQDMEKQKSTSAQKSTGKNKEQKKDDSSNKKSPKNEPQKKDASESEEDDSKSDEDINEGIVLEEQYFVQESDSSEDEESDEDESEEDSMPNIFGTSLADDTEEDDEDYEEDETETKEGLKDVLIKKGVKMFKGVKQDDKSIESNKNSDKIGINSSATDEDEDDDDSMEDEEEEGDDDDDESEEETDEEDDDDEDSEDEVEGNESTLGLKALLGNSLAEDDDDEDFVEPEEEEDDDTDEDDEEDEEEETNNSTLENSQGDADDSLEEVKNDKRTVFVGNLPKEVTKKQLKKQFKKYGRIETIRLRGIVAKTINMPKKVAAITKKVHPKLKSVHAYIKYDSEESAKAALDMNGKIFEGNYLRVDTVYKSDEKYDTKKSVFLGNLQFNIDENTVRKHFEDCGEIESVRIVRDNKTGLGKGFGYVNFKTEDAVALALEMNGTKISNREVRVKPCGEHEKKGRHAKRSLSGEKNGASPKKLKNNAEVAVSTRNKDNAAKRITNKQEKRTNPQQTNMYQGQKADGKKKKGVSKFEKKKKVLAEKLVAKPKKPAN